MKVKKKKRKTTLSVVVREKAPLTTAQQVNKISIATSSLMFNQKRQEIEGGSIVCGGAWGGAADNATTSKQDLHRNISTYVQPKKPRNWRCNYENESHHLVVPMSAKSTTVVVVVVITSIDPPLSRTCYPHSQLHKFPSPKIPKFSSHLNLRTKIDQKTQKFLK